MKVKRALISVTDKQGLIPFAKGLSKLGIEMISTGGTLKLLRENRIKAKSIDELTGFPEIFDGRLKTLHPKVHGGLLMVRKNAKQRRDARKYGIEPIDLVVVNLYKFNEAVAKGVSERETIEHIDIGGPTMLRSAAKNFEYVGVVSSPDDYNAVLEELNSSKGSLSLHTRKKLAAKVFELTYSYDQAIAQFFSMRTNGKASGAGKELPDDISLRFHKIQTLRYGENPHQRAAYYSAAGGAKPKWKQWQGKELSFNNILDIESALLLIQEFSLPAAVVIKHSNPCGVAESHNLEQAAIEAIGCDSMSAFGGIIAVNKELSAASASAIAERLPFFEVLIAPSYEGRALRLFSARKNLRLIEANPFEFSQELAFRFGPLGLLVQDHDKALRNKEAALKKKFKVATKVKPSQEDIRSLMFAWKCAKHVRSNAIVLAKGQVTVGIGAGQMSRVDSVKIACDKAGVKSEGSVLASDGFFPMPDSIKLAHRHGIRLIIQPGGSIRDEEVIQACDQRGIGMVMTGVRHFRH